MYNKTTWINGTTPINETNLNKIENELEKLGNYMGEVAIKNDLPSSPATNDFYLVQGEATFYFWNGSAWKTIGGSVIQGNLADRPSASQAGVLFVATDKQEIYLDTGTDWLRIGGNGTNSNTGDTIVRRDSSGNFSAGTISAYLSGTASHAPWSGITGKPSSYPPSSHTHISSQITDATSSNSGDKIVKRDASGNFSAGTITASLNGTASYANNSGKVNGIKITVSSTAPSSPATNDIWIQV